MELKFLEESLKKVPNRFLLTMMATARARELATGDIPMVEGYQGKKPVVLALQELAEGHLEECPPKEMEALREIRRKVREEALMAQMEAEAARIREQEEALGAAGAAESDLP